MFLKIACNNSKLYVCTTTIDRTQRPEYVKYWLVHSSFEMFLRGWVGSVTFYSELQKQ
jgi:hypothetical protein